MASLCLFCGRLAAGGRTSKCSGAHHHVIEATALAEIWDTHADRLLLVARSIGGPAEDAVQEAFIALAKQSEVPNDPMAWLVRVARNRLLQWQRGNRRRKHREHRAGTACWFDYEIRRVDEQIDGRDVTASLMTLGSPDREVIVMHLWGEMTFEAIGEVIGVSRASAHRAFTRGLVALKGEFNCESTSDSMRICND